MKATVSLIIVVIAALDIVGVLEMPLYASLGIFFTSLLIMLDIIFSDTSKAPKDST